MLLIWILVELIWYSEFDCECVFEDVFEDLFEDLCRDTDGRKQRVRIYRKPKLKY